LEHGKVSSIFTSDNEALFCKRIVFDSGRRCCVHSNIIYDENLVEDKEVGKELGREVSVKFPSSFIKEVTFSVSKQNLLYTTPYDMTFTSIA
jgi:hypothetical protein